MKILSMNQFVFSEVSRLLVAKYGKNPAFDKVLFVLGYNLPNCKPDEIKAKFPDYKIIIYQLEQLFDGSKWATQHVYNWLQRADEVWDYDLDNIEWLKKSGFSPIFKPMEYCNDLCDITHTDKDVDVLFYGYPTDRRMKFMQYWMGKSCYKYTTAFITGVQGDKLKEWIARSKIILNIHAFPEDSRQEQVRLFYPVINGCCVVSEISHRNYFGKSIVECNSPDNIVTTMHTLLDTGEWEHIAANAPSVYNIHCDARK